MDVTPANRLKKLRPYPFAALRRKIQKARKAGKEVLNLGIGDPDRPLSWFRYGDVHRNLYVQQWRNLKEHIRFLRD